MNSRATAPTFKRRKGRFDSMRWLFAFAVIAWAGCGPKMVESEVKPTHPVRGKLLFEGQPTPNAIVKFYAVDGDTGDRIPRGRCQKDGTFQISTYGKDDGAPEGRYKVTVTWNKAGADGESTNDLPARYAKPETSNIPEIEIGPGNNELPVIHLRR